MTDFTPELMQSELDRLAGAYPFVQLNPAKMAELAPLMRAQLGAAGGPSVFDPRHFPNESPAQNDRNTLQFYLVLEASMFCIWRRTPTGDVEAWDIVIDGERYVGARGLAAALMRALRRGHQVLDASVLADLSLDDVKDLYRDEATGTVSLQMLPERQQTFNHVGRALLDRFDGHAAHLFGAADGCLFRDDGLGLIQQLQTHFPYSFGDWPFMKLAFLLARITEARLDLDLPTTDEYRRLATIRDRDHFQGMADYYCPYFYARVGIFDLNEDLRQVLANRLEIPRDSGMEHSFRSKELVAMKDLARVMGDDGLVGEVDYESWKTGYMRCRLCHPGATDQEVPCPYRARCSGFNVRPDLMEIAWPLVLTTTY